MKHSPLFAVALLTLALLLSACSTTAQNSAPRTKARQSLGEDHPLRGKIWDLHAKAFVDKGAMLKALDGKRFVLLGEKHDNPVHHHHQATVLQALVKRRPAVAWEMITPNETSALNQYLAKKERNAEGLGKAIGWEKRGWFSWKLYIPIAKVALAADLAFIPAGISRKDIWKSISAHKMPKGETPPVAPTKPPAKKLPPAARQALGKTITASHCGHANQRMIDMMISVQERRDDFMASQLVGKELNRPLAVLIAGRGHIRQDRGTPYHLRETQNIPAEQILSIGIVEVDDDALTPEKYISYQKGGPPPFDYLWFSKRLDNDDPCEKFKDQLKRLHKRSSKLKRPQKAEQAKTTR